LYQKSCQRFRHLKFEPDESQKIFEAGSQFSVEYFTWPFFDSAHVT
jgi:hypothetical protein